MRRRPQIGWAILVAAVLLAAPASAGAAQVVNGGFESGTLSGWHVQREIQAGNWFAYTGTEAPIGRRRPTPADPVQPPPQGAFAAVADQANPDSLVLYQDVALEPGLGHQLSLLAYYDSYRPIAIPNPDTLSVDPEALRLPNGSFRKNQQFRIDVVRPEAPLDSLDPADILRPVFATRLGGPLRMAPTRLTADLSAFAGQTVRIRIAVAATEEVLNAGVDAVSITTAASGTGGPRRAGRHPVQFSFDGIVSNRRKGTATLRVRVSAPGLLRATDAARGEASTSGGGSRASLRRVQPVTIPIAVARVVTLHLRLTRAGLAALRRRHRLTAAVAVTFMPFSGFPEVARIPVRFIFAKRSK
jgi:hypothetical protein